MMMLSLSYFLLIVNVDCQLGGAFLNLLTLNSQILPIFFCLGNFDDRFLLCQSLRLC